LRRKWIVKTLPELRYTKEHIWVKDLADGTATIGITYFAQENMGEMTYVEFPDIGLQVNQGDFLCVIASSKAIVDLMAPISGEVTELNEALLKEPKLINESPYERGWLLKMRMTNRGELEGLMNNVEYEEFIEKET